MADPYAKHAAGIASVQSYLGAKCPVFSWNGHNRKAIPGGTKIGKGLGGGGYGLESDLQITCLVAQFGTSAQALVESMLKTELTYLGHSYRIDAVMIAAGGQQIRIQCNDANQGA